MSSSGQGAVLEAELVEPPADPGLRLTVPGICIIALALFGIVNSIWMMVAPPAPPNPEAIDPELRESYERGRDVAMASRSPLVTFAYVLMVVGGAGMIRRELRWLGIASAFMAMLPCSPACVAGIPIGIWSLVVLFQRDVKLAYQYKSMKCTILPTPPYSNTP
jgi:hypothetical protein